MLGVSTIRTDDDGSLILVKRGDERRVREADVLAAARHPGVVEVRRVLEDDGAVELHLAFVQAPPLTDLAPLDYGTIVNIAGRVGAIVHDLHERGVRHGDLCAEHVLVDEHHRVTLCGFGNGGLDDQHDPCPPLSADAAGYGRLILHELQRSIDAGVVERDEFGVVALTSIAEETIRATRDGVATSIGPFVDRVLQLHPGEEPSPRRTMRPSGGPWKGIPIPRPMVVGVAVVAVAAAAIAVFTIAGRGPGVVAGPTAAVALPTTTSPGTTVPATVPPETAVSTPFPPSAEGTLTAPPVTTAPSAPPGSLLTSSRPICAVETGPDTDGDGCPDDVHIAEGVIEVGRQRWRLGSPDDLLFVGDWNCDGVATPALVTAGSGDVFFFTTWPDTAAEAAATASLGGVVGAVVLDDGCGGIAVTTADDQRVVIEAVES